MEVFCDCGRKAALRTSWTNRNPGRRFWACPTVVEGKCGFFLWIDPPMCARSIDIIPGLIGRIRENEAAAKSQKLRERVLGGLLLLTWVVIGLVFFASHDVKESTNGGVEGFRGELGV